ncbi:MAG: hypothetical protein JO242_04350, partial [Streptosporangiaceae bacterium]|nr:hypothetical protein [Streptosporangiaceae bacterium]
MPDNRDGRDELADWLSEQVQPLPPPPGTFELIRRRARHRKLRKLAVTAASAAAVIAAGVTIPQVVSLHITGPPSLTGNQAASGSTPARQQNVPMSDGSGAPAASPAPSLAGPPAGVSAQVPPVPPNFAPESVTFIGLGTGWVIGQAGTPGHCATRYCTSIARTDDAGKSWSGVPAPLAGAPNGPDGVSGIRFLNASDGWAFGPELWATHDGGTTWTRIPTNG